MKAFHLLILFALFVFILLSSCTIKKTEVKSSSEVSPTPTLSPEIKSNIFDQYLKSDFAPADGFDFPVGNSDGKGGYTDKSTAKRHDGWFIATRFAEQYSLGIHPGEDWNGAGGGDTDLGQDVLAVANGLVVFAENCGRLWGNVVIVEHIFYENNEKRKIRSVYAHLQEIKVSSGEAVRRRQIIGSIGQDPEKLFPPHLHLELRWDDTLPPTYWASSNGKDETWVREHYAAPTEFIKSHRKLFVPQQEPKLVLVDQKSYKMRLYKNGNLQGEYEVSFGQSKGTKRIQGDNKTPVGMYFVVEKHRGKFDGTYGDYYGGHWIKINYPNKYDAERGMNEGIIDAGQSARIKASWSKRGLTLENTKLGGGIGFHGWIQEWDNDGTRHLSWGCVVMHIYDISRLFDELASGTMVVIF
jgi:murein DD-endopeptidase MepM/ murein hydrolase activator NlpD